MTVSFPRAAILRRARSFPLACLLALAACGGDSYGDWGWFPSRIAYSFPTQLQIFGRTFGGRCAVLTERGDQGEITGTRLIACHILTQGQRINCSFIHADAGDFSEGRMSDDDRIREACYHPLRMALFDQGDDPRDSDSRDRAPERDTYSPPSGGGYTPPSST